MKVALIGFGNAGGKVADELFRYQRQTGREIFRYILAINAARSDLAKLERIPKDDQILIGQTDERVKGHGVGCDPELGAEIARRDRHEMERALDDVPVYEVDAFLVVAGLGGGTGSGGAPVLAESLRGMYDEPVYGLGILPSEDEGGRPSFNAARSLQSFVDATDNLLVFDNDVWRGHQDTVGAGYQRTNRELATRIGALLSTGNIDGGEVSENVMDASDIRRTLATGGLSTIAYAHERLERETQQAQGLLSRFRGNGSHPEVDTAKKVSGVVRKAVQSRLTCPAEIDSTERSLIIVSGPPGELSRKGLESARRWLEQETGSIEVLAGDDPRPGAERLAAVVVLSNVTDVPRVEALQQQATDAAENIENQAETRDEEIEDLIRDDDGTLDPI